MHTKIQVRLLIRLLNSFELGVSVCSRSVLVSSFSVSATASITEGALDSLGEEVILCMMATGKIIEMLMPSRGDDKTLYNERNTEVSQLK
jgi:hypothetical protein